MDDTANFGSEVLALLRQLNAKKERIQAQFAEALAAVDREIEAVSTTARLLRETGEGAHVTIAPRAGVIIPGNLRGKSTRQACIEIAKQNNGMLRITDAKDALLSAGIITTRKNAWGAIYTTLVRSKEFEKASEPGTFRLIPEAPKPAIQQMLTPARPM